MTSRARNIQQIYVRQCRFLEKRYPDLLTLGLTVTDDNAAAVFAAYCDHVKRVDPVAGAQDRARALQAAFAKTGDRKLLDELLAIQTARGMPHRMLRFLAADDPMRVPIENLRLEHARHYGYDFAQFNLKDTDRGGALRFYFSEHSDLLKGKRVLHVAPEAKARPWMQEAARALNFTYTTADGFAEGVDHYVDLCAMPFADGAFDVIIIHRVLEHVIDDQAALAELARILTPGGLLNISVPETLYMAETADWRVPDPDVHHHFRIYGRDFPAMLEKAGFTPGRCDWLLQQSETRLKLFGAYPLLFYNAVKR